MKTLLEAIKEADDVELDCMFSTLRDLRLGIFRKMKSWSLILDLDEEIVLKEAPQDSNGRLLDYQGRHEVASALVARSQQLKKQQQ